MKSNAGKCKKFLVFALKPRKIQNSVGVDFYSEMRVTRGRIKPLIASSLFKEIEGLHAIVIAICAEDPVASNPSPLMMQPRSRGCDSALGCLRRRCFSRAIQETFSHAHMCVIL
jgi:hypothetical protein